MLGGATEGLGPISRAIRHGAAASRRERLAVAAKTHPIGAVEKLAGRDTRSRLNGALRKESPVLLRPTTRP